MLPAPIAPGFARHCVAVEGRSEAVGTCCWRGAHGARRGCSTLPDPKDARDPVHDPAEGPPGRSLLRFAAAFRRAAEARPPEPRRSTASGQVWSGKRDSNPRPSDGKASRQIGALCSKFFPNQGAAGEPPTTFLLADLKPCNQPISKVTIGRRLRRADHRVPRVTRLSRRSPLSAFPVPATLRPSKASLGPSRVRRDRPEIALSSSPRLLPIPGYSTARSCSGNDR